MSVPPFSANSSAPFDDPRLEEELHRARLARPEAGMPSRASLDQVYARIADRGPTVGLPRWSEGPLKAVAWSAPVLASAALVWALHARTPNGETIPRAKVAETPLTDSSPSDSLSISPGESQLSPEASFSPASPHQPVPPAGPLGAKEGQGEGSRLNERPRRRPSLAAAEPIKEAPPPTPPAQAEALAVADILTQLNVRRDPRGALDGIERYRERFPRGSLSHQVDIARVEANLQLGQRTEAITFLEGLREPTPELALLYAELLVALERCADAEPLWNQLLVGTVPSAQRARALYGRATCRAKDGQALAAREDFRHYLRLVPAGAKADAVRAYLGDPEP